MNELFNHTFQLGHHTLTVFEIFEATLVVVLAHSERDAMLAIAISIATAMIAETVTVVATAIKDGGRRTRRIKR